MGSWGNRPDSGERGVGGLFGVDGVVFAAFAPVGLISSGHLEDVEAGGVEVTHQPGSVGAGALHSDSKTGECQVFPGFVTLTTIGPGGYRGVGGVLAAS